MSLIFFMSANPSPGTFSNVPDYLLHGGGYFVLAVLVVRALARGLARKPARGTIYAALALTILYGISDEWHQAHVAGRDSSIADVAADAAGAFLAAATIVLFWKLRGVYQSE